MNFGILFQSYSFTKFPLLKYLKIYVVVHGNTATTTCHYNFRYYKRGPAKGEIC